MPSAWRRPASKWPTRSTRTWCTGSSCSAAWSTPRTPRSPNAARAFARLLRRARAESRRKSAGENSRMKSDLKTRHGGKILADALATQGVKLAFGVPGESYLPVLDGMHDLRERLSFIVCRQEGGASYMAEAYGKLTGEPGVLFVTRGPGATNGAIGVHTGFQDSTPMVVFIGQVPNEFAEREAFQEIDYRRMYGQMVKWVAQIDRVERIPEYVSRAFHTAQAGRPGPVVLALPEDALFSQAAVADVPKHHVVRSSPSASDMQEVEKLLAKAKSPFVLLGGGGWDRETALKL